jgi:hypothetical protein
MGRLAGHLGKIGGGTNTTAPSRAEIALVEAVEELTEVVRGNLEHWMKIDLTAKLRDRIGKHLKTAGSTAELTPKDRDYLWGEIMYIIEEALKGK